MHSRDRLLQLIQQVYAAPGSQERWRAFLDDLYATFDASAANVISHDLKSHRWGTSVTAGLNAAALDVCDHHDDVVRVMGSLIEAGPQVLSVISISGTERPRVFSRSDAALLEALVPHVRRALRLHRRLAAAESASDVLTGVIERVSHAVLFIDTQGKVSFMNAAAKKLVEARDGLMLDDGELRTARRADTARLRRLLSVAAKTSAGQNTAAGGAFSVSRPSGRRPLVALVLPSSQGPMSVSGLEPPAAMILVTDPESAEVPNETVLCALLGLTPAEARLTRLVARGQTLAEAASCLGLRMETVRSRMKDVFQKTDTHRQADLIRLVLNGTPRL